MKPFVLCLCLFLFPSLHAQEKLGYHNIRTDGKGIIKPWYNDDPGTSFDYIINRVWNFWDTMRTDLNGLPYYMNHMVWTPGLDDARGLGGDQLQMALSSWQLLYAYSGNERVKQNMKFIADYYLSHSLSPSGCQWPDLPFPYNTLIFSGVFDGDMMIGPGFLQPDKAGSFALELIHLYKMCSSEYYMQTTRAKYLDAAIKIAHTLAAHLQPGDYDHSPLPFKVNAYTGETTDVSRYTSNWCGTMELFLALQQLDPTHADVYQKSFQVLLNWMKAYPLKNNRWGPFFEDVPGWSNTQINAITFARFIMEYRIYFPDWQKQVSGIFDWIYHDLGNETWKKYGVTVVNEQSAYHVPGQSHTSREAAAELLYSFLSRDTARKANAIRQLSWSTYMVNADGHNRYPKDEIWLTDGYGDYVRHLLRSMAVYPELAPSTADHIVSSSSVIQRVDYRGQAHKFLMTEVKEENISRLRVFYRTYDSSGTETIRMTQKPSAVLLNGKAISEENSSEQQGYRWKSLDQGGVLFIRRLQGSEVTVLE
ncbi:MAG: hypothetical protein Q8918_10975 [Bacteroidota bacterium]|nr:hypothetical protein [Bacteroidota bacterium]MDP4212674.1 hypothetical protein [Bacteroidota bacterium]MDP4250619.1 hypothetical protein [Bacteroidota bacterium]